jgi:hypothetical protein
MCGKNRARTQKACAAVSVRCRAPYRNVNKLLPISSHFQTFFCHHSSHTCAPDFFQGGGVSHFRGGGVKFVDPIFNGQVFSKKKFKFFFPKKYKKLFVLCFFEKKLKKFRQYQVNFVLIQAFLTI